MSCLYISLIFILTKRKKLDTVVFITKKVVDRKLIVDRLLVSISDRELINF